MTDNENEQEVLYERGELKVKLDLRRCVSNAKCTTAAPGIFVLDQETGYLTVENGDRATIEQLFAGARACPTQAISIEQYGRRVFPLILTPMFGDKAEPGDAAAAGDGQE